MRFLPRFVAATITQERTRVCFTGPRVCTVTLTERSRLGFYSLSRTNTQSNTQWLDCSDSEWVWEGDKHPIGYTFSGGMWPPPSLPQTTSGTAINHISPGSRCGWVVERSTGPWDSPQTLDGKRWRPGTRSLNNTNICGSWLLYTNDVSAEIRRRNVKKCLQFCHYFSL